MASADGVGLGPAARLVPMLRSVLDQEPTREEVGDTAAFQLTLAVVELLRRVVGPCALVVDDVQWADLDSLDLIRRLARHVFGLPVLLVLVCRANEPDVRPELADVFGELARWAPHREELQGLSPGDVSQLLETHHQSASAELAAWLHSRTGGNPFFVEELIRMLREEDDAGNRKTDSATSRSAGVPAGVQDVVRRRLATLPPPVATLLEVASVAGPTFERDVVVAASGLDADAAEAAVADAVRAGLVTRARRSEFRFAHALVQDAVQHRVEDDPDVHARVAIAMEAAWSQALDDRSARLAHHFLLAGRAYARPAWTYARRAAAEAMRQHAPLEAARLLEAALRAQASDPEASDLDREDVLLDLTSARARAGQEKAAWRAMHAAAESGLAAGDVVRAASAATTVGAHSVWRWREYDVIDADSVALFERLRAGLPQTESALRAQVLALLGAELYYCPDPARALSYSDEALELARTDGTSAAIARVLELRHSILERPASLEERLAIAEELLVLPAVTTDPAAMARALVFRGKDRLEAGYVRAGRADHARARRLAEEHSLAPTLVALAYADSVMLIAQGEFARAEQAAADAVEQHHATTLPGANELPAVLTAILRLTHGTLPEAEPLLEAAAATDPDGVFADLHALALVRGGRRQDALALLGPWAHRAAPAPDYVWLARMVIRAALCAELGTPPDAQQLRTDLEPYIDRLAIAGTGIAVLGFVSLATARLAASSGDLDIAVADYRRSLRVHDEAGFAPFAATSAHELAAALRARGGPTDDAEAEVHAAEADRLARSLQMRLPAL
jgi:tetratricopeptide (TPR) repeat protein